MTEIRLGLPVIGFADRASFEQWLVSQPSDAPGLWIKFAKKRAELASLSKAEAIDVALCHGWIDGLLNRYDAAHWLVRFTPRKPRSKWPEINRGRARQLIGAARKGKGGVAQIKAAQADGRWKAADAAAG